MAAAARRQMQNWRRHDDKGSSSAMTKTELAARQGRERRRDKEGRGGATTKAELAAQR